MKKIPDKTVWKNYESLSTAAAHFFVVACHEAIARHGKFVVALSGGITPHRMFELLASREFSANIPWKKVFLFWSDERFVIHSSPDSNFFMAKKALIDHVDIPAKNIFPVPVTGDPEQNARQYEATIKKFFATEKAAFDWVMLGTGEDGHTASLFPHTPVLIESRRLVKQVWLKDKQTWRITFTYPLINRAHRIIVLVSGKEKAKVVEAVFRRPVKRIFPVQYIKAEKSLWLIDKAAKGK